ncbi:AlpA family phage regulatory protein [Bradyrhizobium sp. NBAIM01]|nr:AlpA family phage regulatory protein [Bradyrhizobium sp. NBAIM01]
MTLLAQREEPRAASHLIECNDLLDLRAVCRLIGGTKPIHPATLYRGMKAGRYPAPIKVGPNASRWLRSECEAALAAMIARRAER